VSPLKIIEMQVSLKAVLNPVPGFLNKTALMLTSKSIFAFAKCKVPATGSYSSVY
jgi:hypothetical protein